VQGFAGDGGPASAAELNAASDIAVDSTGVIWVADHREQLYPHIGPFPPLRSLRRSSNRATPWNGASLTPGDVAPGEIITIFGSGFDPNRRSFCLTGKSAITFYIGASQINALAPATLTPGSTTQISIVVDGSAVAVFSSNVAALRRASSPSPVEWDRQQRLTRMDRELGVESRCTRIHHRAVCHGPRQRLERR